jgi:hypothetical protein
MISYYRKKVPGMNVSRVREDVQCPMLRLETHDDLVSLCGVFGESVIVDARVRPGNGRPWNLKSNDAINVVVDYDERECPFKLKTQRDGVDFCFDQRHGRLYIFVRYSKYEYFPDAEHLSLISEAFINMDRPLSLPGGGRDGNGGGNGGEGADDENGEGVGVAHEVQLREEISEFFHEEELFVVMEVNANSVSAQCCYPVSSANYDTVVVFDNIDYVLQKVKERLGND